MRRWIDPDDRRRQLIEATETAGACAREVFSGLIRATKRLLESYDEEQLLAIRDFLDRTGELTAAYSDELTRHDDSPPATAPKSTSQKARPSDATNIIPAPPGAPCLVGSSAGLAPKGGQRTMPLTRSRYLGADHRHARS